MKGSAEFYAVGSEQKMERATPNTKDGTHALTKGVISIPSVGAFLDSSHRAAALVSWLGW